MTSPCPNLGRTSLVVLLLAGLLALIFQGPRHGLPVVPRNSADQNILRVAWTQRTPPDPQMRGMTLAQHNLLILSLWEPLVECNPQTGEPEPAAALRWSWSEDRLILTIDLRRDARWSNGNPVTAADFARGWIRLLKGKKEGAEILAPLKNALAYQRGDLSDANSLGVQAVDAHTLRLTLEKPRSTFVMELADPLLSPVDVSSDAVLTNKSYLTIPASLVTNGPFRLVRASADGYTLARNEFYHGRTEVVLDGIQFVGATSLSVAQLMLAAGVVDLVTPTSWGKNRTSPTDRPFSIATEFQPTVHSVNFNVSRAPLADGRVRQALALALDRANPIKHYDAEDMRAAWSWVPEMPGRPGLTLLHEDAELGRRLLAEAGYPGGKGFPILRMAMPLERLPNPFIAVWTERWYQELGVRTYVAYEERKKRAERIKAGDYDILYNQLTATVPDAGDLLGIFSSHSNMNKTDWTDPVVENLLAEANSQTGQEHLALLEQVERRVMTELPSIPLMFDLRRTSLADEVHGWSPDPMMRQNLKRLHLVPGI